jgi:hypothetical protein
MCFKKRLESSPRRLWLEMAAGTATQTRIPRPRRNSGLVVRGGDSWLGLVAATTKGVGERSRVRVTIRTTTPIRGDAFRLVVQSYAASALNQGRTLHDLGTPVASLQRAVTQEELKSGLCIDVVPVGADCHDPEDLLVYAWVEPGRPDLEFDAALARPMLGALRGSAVSRRDSVRGITAELSLTAA